MDREPQMFLICSSDISNDFSLEIFIRKAKEGYITPT